MFGSADVFLWNMSLPFHSQVLISKNIIIFLISLLGSTQIGPGAKLSGRPGLNFPRTVYCAAIWVSLTNIACQTLIKTPKDVKNDTTRMVRMSNLGGEQRGPSTRALRESLAGKRFQSGGVLLFWSDHRVTMVILILITPIKSKYILKDSRRPVKEELSCGQRVEVAEGEDIRWDKCNSDFFDGRSQIHLKCILDEKLSYEIPCEVAYRNFWSLLLGNLSIVAHRTWPFFHSLFKLTLSRLTKQHFSRLYSWKPQLIHHGIYVFQKGPIKIWWIVKL